MAIPAASTPAKMEGMAFRRGMSRKAAARAPVQAPVPGRGMATNSISPRYLYFVTFCPFRWAFFSSLSTSRFSRGSLRRIHWKIRRIYTNMKGTGRIFPMMAARYAAHTGRPRATPKGMPPRSSTTGTIDTNIVKQNSPAGFCVSHCMISIADLCNLSFPTPPQRGETCKKAPALKPGPR